MFSGVGQVTTEETRQSFDLGPRDVLIETHYSCISAGTELAKLSGLQAIDFPAHIGNRAVGRILEVGSEVASVRQGNLVYSHLHHTSHSLGARLVCPLPDELDRPAAATLGLALVAMTGVQTAGAELGDTAVVVGAGLVGQFAAQLLERSGVRTILVDLAAGRLAVARGCGITHTVDASAEDSVAVVTELTGGEGADVVLDGTERCATQGLAGDQSVFWNYHNSLSVRLEWFGSGSTGKNTGATRGRLRLGRQGGRGVRGRDYQEASPSGLRELPYRTSCLGDTVHDPGRDFSQLLGVGAPVSRD